MELREKVTTYEHNYFCDEPKCFGVVKSTGVALLTMPAKYEYVCSSCRKTYILGKIYPYTEFTKD